MTLKKVKLHPHFQKLFKALTLDKQKLNIVSMEVSGGLGRVTFYLKYDNKDWTMNIIGPTE
jgi:hypothetical protein